MELESLIQTIGFPAVCLIAIATYLPKVFDKFFTLIENNIKSMREDDKTSMKMLHRELNYSREINTELLRTNREISETNRLLATEIKSDVGNIEKKLDNFMDKTIEALRNKVE